MLVQHKLIGGKGIFYIGKEGAILAELVYTKPSADKMNIEHTEVDESLSGKRVGLQLVSTAVAYARTHSLKIIPLCPYAKSVFDKEPAFSDLLQ